MASGIEWDWAVIWEWVGLLAIVLIVTPALWETFWKWRRYRKSKR